VERVRIDKWLWAARFFKTRSAATEAVAGGHVKVNGDRAKPSREVSVGDQLDIKRDQQRWTVDVRAVADRRGPAAAARELYEETPESAAAREQRRLEAKASRPLGAGLGARPTKRDRRRLHALRRGQRRH
jgi:ribosome-associated heat shock protein Hsp15